MKTPRLAAILASAALILAAPARPATPADDEKKKSKSPLERFSGEQRKN